jgi:hypothetical protein
MADSTKWFREHASQVVQEFSAHVHEQDRARQAAKDSGQDFVPPEEQKRQREAIMQKLLAAFGLPKLELQAKLGIDRATWDRWRAMASVPHRSYLETLARLADKDDRPDDHIETRPRPIDVLSLSPRTWGRLRLVYSLFQWESAVFRFRSPYLGEKMVADMALLALRGCSLVYLMANPADWISQYIANLLKVFGPETAARALSRICVMEIPAEDLKKEQFALFNHNATDTNFSVGYLWNSDSSDDKDQPAPSTPADYTAVPVNDPTFYCLRREYADSLKQAFEVIQKRSPKDFWAPMSDAQPWQSRLKIPVVGLKKDESGKNVIDCFGPDTERCAE